eukprot:2041590-Rhodomonas_salina.2
MYNSISSRDELLTRGMCACCDSTRTRRSQRTSASSSSTPTSRASSSLSSRTTLRFRPLSLSQTLSLLDPEPRALAKRVFLCWCVVLLMVPCVLAGVLRADPLGSQRVLPGVRRRPALRGVALHARAHRHPGRRVPDPDDSGPGIAPPAIETPRLMSGVDARCGGTRWWRWAGCG